MQKIVYIAHPISGNIEENLKDIIRILRIINTNSHRLNPDKLMIKMDKWHNSNSDLPAYKYLNISFDEYKSFVQQDRFVFTYDFSDIVPVAPYYHDIIALDDNNQAERARGIQNDIALIKSGVFKEIWLTGDKISFGMQCEVELAKELNIPVIDYINKI